jgi:hypothetical protein
MRKPSEKQRQLNKAEANAETAAESARFWVKVASGYSHENRGERGAASRKSPKKAKRGLSKARRRVDRAVIGVEAGEEDEV